MNEERRTKNEELKNEELKNSRPVAALAGSQVLGSSFVVLILSFSFFVCSSVVL
jgi:hypothetical protein